MATNEELVARHQVGDKSAFTELLKQNSGFISNAVRAIRRPNDNDFDDFMQLANIAMFTAAENFDASKGVKFLTHAGWKLKSEFSHFFSYEAAGKRQRTEISIYGKNEDDQDFQFVDDAESHVESLANNEDKTRLLSIAEKRINRLKPEWREIVRRRLYGESCRSIAGDVGVSRARIHQIHQRALSILKYETFWWTKEHDRTLREGYGVIATAKLAEEIGCTPASIWYRRIKIGLPRKLALWLPEHDDVIKANIQASDSSLALRFGRTETAIKVRRQRIRAVRHTHSDESLKDRIVSLHEQQLTTTQIGELVGKHPETVRTILRKRGIEAGEYRELPGWKNSEKRRVSCGNVARKKQERDAIRARELVDEDVPYPAALVLHVLSVSGPADRDEISRRCVEACRSRGWHPVVTSWQPALQWAKFLRDKNLVEESGRGNVRRTYTAMRLNSGAQSNGVL